MGGPAPTTDRAGEAGGIAIHLTILASIVVVALGLWFVNAAVFPHLLLGKAFATVLAIAVLYGVFRVALENVLAHRISDPRARYSVRRVLRTLFYLTSFAAVVLVWVEDTQAILVSYGLLAAGLAIALQDLFKNLVGGILVLATGTYRVGDRVQLGRTTGDVLDIGILYTTLLELGEWVGGNQATGRLTIVPNGALLSQPAHNFTKDHNFIWDEITVPIAYDSDWRAARETILGIVAEATADVVQRAEQEMAKIGEKYYFTRRAVEPALYLTLTDNWIDVHVRYVTDVRERRPLKARISERALTKIEASSGRIKLASTTLRIVDFPDIAIRERRSD